jgi:hypothetical protein
MLEQFSALFASNQPLSMYILVKTMKLSLNQCPCQIRIYVSLLHVSLSFTASHPPDPPLLCHECRKFASPLPDHLI